MNDLRDRMSLQVPELSELCMHGWDLVAWNDPVLPDPRLAGKASPVWSAFSILSLRRGNEIISLDYVLRDNLRRCPAPADWPSSATRICWMYDEVDMARAGETAARCIKAAALALTPIADPGYHCGYKVVERRAIVRRMKMSGFVSKALPLGPMTVARRSLLRRLDARGRQNATLLGMLLAIQLACIIFAPLHKIDSDSLQGLTAIAAIGACLAPPTLLAMWAVFGPGPLVVRVPLTTWLAAVLQVAILFAIVREDPSNTPYSLIASTCWFLAFVFAQTPLWIIRGLRRWRFVRSAHVEAAMLAEPVGGTESRRNQFTMRGLLVWTLAAALPLAAFRAMAPAVPFDAEALFAFLPFIVLGGMVAALAGLPSVALAWIFLAAGRRPVLRVVLSLVLLAGVPGGVWLFAELANGPELSELMPILAGTIANGVIMLSVIGACGYRLHRPCRSFAGEGQRRDGASVAARSPLSRVRFAAALAPLICVAAAILSVVPYQLRQWRQAAIAAEWARRGVQVGFNESGKLIGVNGIHPDFSSDELLRRISELNDLETLTLARARIGDRQLVLLAPLTSVRTIDLSDCEITDAGLSQIVQFKNLEILNLTNTRITDAGLAKLKALPRLFSLDLQLTDVTDAGLAALAELPRLDQLNVSLTAVNAEAAKRFMAARPKVTLEYGASDALLSRQLVNRRTVVMPMAGGVAVNRAIAMHPRPLKRLHAHGMYKLAGGVITVTDAGLRSLTQFTELEELDLHDTAVTDQGLPLLSKLTALKTLDLRGTKVTEQGTAALARSLPDCRIIR